MGEEYGGGGAGRGQAAHAIRAVALAEYDAAVRENPELCPLLLDGDRRSGSQARSAAISALC